MIYEEKLLEHKVQKVSNGCELLCAEVIKSKQDMYIYIYIYMKVLCFTASNLMREKRRESKGHWREEDDSYKLHPLGPTEPACLHASLQTCSYHLLFFQERGFEIFF